MDTSTSNRNEPSTHSSSDNINVERDTNKPFAQPATGVAGHASQGGQKTQTGTSTPSTPDAAHHQATGMVNQAGQDNQRSPSSAGMQSGQSQDMRTSGGGRSMSSFDRFSRDPFALMQQMSEEMDRLFDAVFLGRYPRTSGQQTTSMPRMWSPQLEIAERNNKVIVCADVPGVNKSDLHVEVNDGMLTIRGERNESQEDNTSGYRRSERHYGSFQRTIALPEGVSAEDIQAQLKDGVLEVSIPAPQRPQQTGRRVDIQGS